MKCLSNDRKKFEKCKYLVSVYLEMHCKCRMQITRKRYQVSRKCPFIPKPSIPSLRKLIVEVLVTHDKSKLCLSIQVGGSAGLRRATVKEELRSHIE